MSSLGDYAKDHAKDQAKDEARKSSPSSSIGLHAQAGAALSKDEHGRAVGTNRTHCATVQRSFSCANSTWNLRCRAGARCIRYRPKHARNRRQLGKNRIVTQNASSHSWPHTTK